MHYNTNDWIHEEGDIATVGITKKAAKELDEVSFIEFPAIGSKITPEETAVVVESTKAAIDFAFPVTGEVVEINEKLRQTPALLLEAPEGDGWLFKVRIRS